MKYIHKLRPLNEWWVGLIYIGNGVLLLLAALLGYWAFYLKFLGALFLVVAAIRVIISLRMGNYAYLAGTLHYSVIALLCFAITGENKALITALMGIFFFTLFLNVAMFVSKRSNGDGAKYWNWRHIRWKTQRTVLPPVRNRRPKLSIQERIFWHLPGLWQKA